MDDFKTKDNLKGQSTAPKSRSTKKSDSTKKSRLTEKIVITPLANPVITGIFQSVELSGQAFRSLVNAILADSGGVLIDEILTVTPESDHHSGLKNRGFRIDVEGLTVNGERIIVEIQLAVFLQMNERILLYINREFNAQTKVGDKLPDTIDSLRRVIVITILDYTLRENGKGFHHVGGLMYKDAPHESMTDLFEIHHLELPSFLEIIPDFNNPLHCWMTAFCRAHKGKTSLKEVVEMDPRLKSFYQADQGFAQFVDRYNLVISDPKTLKEYLSWMDDQVVYA
ncbi:MAG: Rpn family recombination-promoting nuclease/putative transposase, partial [Deltaproteobacteria bacterium]|nr:Rpn family recombination-promoting nuclease/putative transposase [Deltaproteobacteria bacterium]